MKMSQAALVIFALSEMNESFIYYLDDIFWNVTKTNMLYTEKCINDLPASSHSVATKKIKQIHSSLPEEHYS